MYFPVDQYVTGRLYLFFDITKEFLKPLPELRNHRFLDTEAGRHRVSAVCGQHRRTLFQNLVQRETGKASRGSSADAVLQRDHYDRCAVQFLQTRSNDPDHAGMPPVGSQNDRPRFFLAVKHSYRFLKNLRIEFPSLSVYILQFVRQRSRFIACLRCQKAERLRRIPESARGVNPRSEPERDCRYADLFRSGSIDQAAKADVPRVGQTVQAVPDEYPVFTRHGRHIRYGADRDKIKVGGQIVAVTTSPGTKSVRKFPGETHTGECFVRVRTPRTLRVQDRHGVRKDLLRLVMVRDDTIDSVRRGIRYLFAIGDSAVHRDQQGDTRRLHFVNRDSRETVSLAQSIGKTTDGPDTEAVEEPVQERRSSDSVCIEIPENSDFFIFFQRQTDAANRLIHPAEKKRIFKVFQGGMKKMVRVSGISQSALPEETGNERLYIQSGRDFGHSRFRRLLFNLPDRSRIKHVGILL